MIHTIDLGFLGTEASIAAYVIPTENGAVLIECGPHSTIDALEAGLQRLGLAFEDIHTLLLTHIHFDHAGAAWYLAQKGTNVYVHPRGYKHLLSPERLYESARMIYQDKMDELWGEMRPIAPERLFAVEDRQAVEADGLTFRAVFTPGHAVHHIAWQLEEVVFSGDVGGVKIAHGPVVPPCPPPDVNIEDWRTSVEAMRSLKAKQLYLTHYGPVDQVEEHLDELLQCIERYAAWSKPYAEKQVDPAVVTERFVEMVEKDFRAAGMDAELMAAYRAANPPWMSVAGLLRYWKKRLAGPGK